MQPKIKHDHHKGSFADQKAPENESSLLEIDLRAETPDGNLYQEILLLRLEQALETGKGIHRAETNSDLSPGILRLSYDPQVLTTEEAHQSAREVWAAILRRYPVDNFSLEDLDCSDCALALEHSLERRSGILDVEVSYSNSKMQVIYDRQTTNRRAVEREVRRIGYQIPPNKLQLWYRDNQMLILSLLGGLMLTFGWAGARLGVFSPAISLGFYLAAYVLAGYDISRHAWHHVVRERRFDTDLLMLAAALGAALLGEWPEGALLLVLFSTGHALEGRALGRAQKAIRGLGGLTPQSALVRRGTEETELAIRELELGDHVIIKPGERIPVDGSIIQGHSLVDQSPITGESMPISKSPGNSVFAGSINGQGSLEVDVTRLAKDSTLARVIELVEQARGQKSPTQLFSERFTRIFVPVVLVADLLLIIIPPFFGVPWRESFLQAMTLLVATSPCALALGTPSTVLAGLARAARSGVLVKGGAHLENLGSMKALAFDKTGTITSGEPQVTDVVAFAPYDEGTLLSLAAALEIHAAHPLADAILQYTRENKITPVQGGELISHSGLGVETSYNGSILRIGSSDHLQQAGVSLTDETLALSSRFQSEGKTIALVGHGDQVVGLIALADSLRPEARSTISRLRSLGLREMVMLTGDNIQAAEAVARSAGIEQVQAGLMPAEKLEAIDRLSQTYSSVGMVGDGVNDAPALANATVGIAMGGAKTSVALETADVVLMADDLSRLPFAVGLGRKSRTIIRQNLAISLGVIGGLIILTLTNLTGITLAIILHEGSTLLVVLNALRLLGYRDLHAPSDKMVVIG
jgi:Zn2+/Cd2+-exporting ATPase